MLSRIIRFIISLVKFIFIGDIVISEVYDKRISICSSCDHLVKYHCQICKCRVKVKAKWTTETCPKNKW